MSSTFGENLKLSIFGQSHGPAIGMTLDGIPAGLSVDFEKLQQFLDRRAPGQADWSTPRKEEDTPEFLSGIVDGFTCGAPIAAVIRNQNARSKDYGTLRDIPRPGHGDYTAQVKYGAHRDVAGGGHSSGRLTAPLCIAGGLCKQWLEHMGIRIRARITSVGSVCDNICLDPVAPQIDLIGNDFPVCSQEAGAAMRRRIAEVKAEGDSIGGIIECYAVGVPASLGEPMFGGVESRIAQIVYGIPAVKSISFGAGCSAAHSRGSQYNDSFCVDHSTVKTKTNNCGGILGGITNGMPVIFQTVIKPTPSIRLPQGSVDLRTMEEVTLEIQCRHDPCIVPRAVPVVEAAAAIAIYDMVLTTGSR